MSTIALIAGTSAVRARRTIGVTAGTAGTVADAARRPAAVRALLQPCRGPEHHHRAGNLQCVPTPRPTAVALVTLGCARNEVDSEELAGRLGDRRVGADRGRRGRRRRRGQHLRLHRLGQEGLDRHPARRRRHRPQGRRRGLPGRALRHAAGRLAARGRRRARLRLLRRHRRPPRRRRGGPPGQPARPARPPHPAAGVAGRAPGGGSGRRARARLAADERRAGPPRRRPGRLPQARLGLRPPVHVLRHPVLPRLVRLPPAGRRAGRGGVAGLDRRARARAGQRELDVLRQGPRRPAGARDAAAAAGRRRRHRADAGVLPAAGRAAAGPAGGARRPRPASRPTSTCPSSTPARRCCAG